MLYMYIYTNIYIYVYMYSNIHIFVYIGMEVPPGWSLFDQKKMMLSLRVTSSASAFLRKRSGIQLGICLHVCMY
jgi:hypothetical protein